MTYVLYNRMGSGGFAVEAAMALAGVEYRLEKLDSRPNEPLKTKIEYLNGWGQVPVLNLPDGTIMTELCAIMTHLTCVEDGCQRGPHLWVEDHPAFLRWAAYLCVNVYEGILRQTYPDRFCLTSGRTGSALDVGSDAWLLNNVSAAGERRTHEALLHIQDATKMHRFLIGDRMSGCDVILAMLYAWHNQRPDLKRLAWITEQVATHDVVRPIWRANFETRLDFKWHEL